MAQRRKRYREYLDKASDIKMPRTSLFAFGKMQEQRQLFSNNNSDEITPTTDENQIHLTDPEYNLDKSGSSSPTTVDDCEDENSSEIHSSDSEYNGLTSSPSTVNTSKEENSSEIDSLSASLSSSTLSTPESDHPPSPDDPIAPNLEEAILPSDKKRKYHQAFSPAQDRRPLRPIIIDGNNMAMSHGKITGTFSSRGISLAVQYFLDRGHKDVVAILPQFRRHKTEAISFRTTEPELLDTMEMAGHLIYSPCRIVDSHPRNPYDDRFILRLAVLNKGIVVSNDQFIDLSIENADYKFVAENRLLMYMFARDHFIPAEDPMGKEGPLISDFLRF